MSKKNDPEMAEKKVEQILTVSVKITKSVFKEYHDNGFSEETAWNDIMSRTQRALEREFSGEIDADEMELSTEDWFICPVERAALDRALAEARRLEHYLDTGKRILREVGGK
jgi:hypothetical protein